MSCSSAFSGWFRVSSMAARRTETCTAWSSVSAGRSCNRASDRLSAARLSAHARSVAVRPSSTWQSPKGFAAAAPFRTSAGPRRSLRLNRSTARPTYRRTSHRTAVTSTAGSSVQTNGRHCSRTFASSERPTDMFAGRENPFLAGGNEVSLERLRADVAELARQATRSNVTIFGIDPRALSGPPTIEPNLNDATWQQYWTTTRNSPQVISEQTGGHVTQDDLDWNLTRILSAMR